MRFQVLLACLSAVVSAAQLEARGYLPYPTRPSCAYKHCLYGTKLAASYGPDATKYCNSLIGKGPITKTITTVSVTTISSTPTTTITRTVIFDPLPITSTITVFTTKTITTVRASTSSSTTTLPNTTVTSQPCIATRAVPYGVYTPKPNYPPFVTQGCRSTNPPLAKVKSACSCYLGNNYGYYGYGPTVTVTDIVTVISDGELVTKFVDITIRPDPPTIYSTVTSTVSTLVTSTIVTTTVITVPGRTITVPCPTRTYY